MGAMVNMLQGLSRCGMSKWIVEPYVLHYGVDRLNQFFNMHDFHLLDKPGCFGISWSSTSGIFIEQELLFWKSRKRIMSLRLRFLQLMRFGLLHYVCKNCTVFMTVNERSQNELLILLLPPKDINDIDVSHVMFSLGGYSLLMCFKSCMVHACYKFAFQFSANIFIMLSTKNFMHACMFLQNMCYVVFPYTIPIWKYFWQNTCVLMN